jgi:hypothetical protein
MLAVHSEKVVNLYAEAYEKLYNRKPKDMHIIDQEWVIVNGARMRVSELEFLTKQLQQEYAQGVADKRTMIDRLVKWFRGY